MSDYFVREPEAPAVPLLVSIPHTGTDVPDDIAARFASPGVAALPDTDWHLHRLYDFVPRLGARTLYARFSRYVADLNRPADGSLLYPGRPETALVPAATFAGEPIYATGDEPGAAEIAQRIERFWKPYHERLERELAALRERFGYALLFDAHSIASEVPRLVPGRLPHLMLGDADGRSAAPELSLAVLAVHAKSGLEHRRNDPFKGGFITRAYGRPEGHVHALQLEMSQRSYMIEGAPFAFGEALAAALRPTLTATLRALVDAARRLYG